MLPKTPIQILNFLWKQTTVPLKLSKIVMSSTVIIKKLHSKNILFKLLFLSMISNEIKQNTTLTEICFDDLWAH